MKRTRSGAHKVYASIVSKALGRWLKSPEEVHHLNGDYNDNRHENLVVCPNREYHMLIHKRAEALAACGNANYKKCMCCKQWDHPANMHFTPVARRYWHKACKAAAVYNQQKANRVYTT